MDVLVTWVGARDPTWVNPRTGKREAGPILSMLRARRFDLLYMLVHVPLAGAADRDNEFARRGAAVVRECRAMSMPVRQCPVALALVTDYVEIYRAVNEVCQRIRRAGNAGDEHYVFLSPGTPQMQTIWILLVQAGLFPARLIDAAPPDLLLPGQQLWREVDLSLADFPQVRDPGDAVRTVGVLQAQNANMRAENARLLAENTRLRAEMDAVSASAAAADHSIPPGFDLTRYLKVEKVRYYARALEQAAGDVPRAACLLSVPAHTFRQQAERLGIRPRRPRNRAREP